MSAFDPAAPLRLPRCDACARTHWYPRPFCPFCFSDRMGTIVASGRGTVYSYSVAAADGAVMAYVELEEGPRMLTRLVDTPAHLLRIGLAVRLVWRAGPGGEPQRPFFTAASTAPAAA
jgi:uncharacterized OB-fold protein